MYRATASLGSQVLFKDTTVLQLCPQSSMYIQYLVCFIKNTFCMFYFVVNTVAWMTGQVSGLSKPDPQIFAFRRPSSGIVA